MENQHYHGKPKNEGILMQNVFANDLRSEAISCINGLIRSS